MDGVVPASQHPNADLIEAGVSVHMIAATESVACSHLLTCDDRFRKRYHGPLNVLSPANFVVEYFQQTL